MQLGISVADMELLTVGLVNDMFVENANDDCEYQQMAGQEDFDSFSN